MDRLEEGSSFAERQDAGNADRKQALRELAQEAQESGTYDVPLEAYSEALAEARVKCRSCPGRAPA